MPPKNKRSAKTYEKDDFVVGSDSEPDIKRKKAEPKKSTATAQKEPGQQHKDDEGNPYWELGGRLRRVTLSSFKGKMLVNIREHYEKDGKVLPGKKGISLSIDQFNTLLTALPQMTAYLEGQNIEVVHPANVASKTAKPKKEEAGKDSDDKSPTVEQSEDKAVSDAEDTD